MNADLLNAKAFTIWVLPNGQNVGISDYHYGMSVEPTLKGTLEFMAKHPEDRFFVNLNIDYKDDYVIHVCFEYHGGMIIDKDKNWVGIRKTGEEKIFWNTEKECDELFAEIKFSELYEYICELFQFDKKYNPKP